MFYGIVEFGKSSSGITGDRWWLWPVRSSRMVVVVVVLVLVLVEPV